MRYYVAWTNSDPIYQQYLPDINVLISPPNVSRSWKVCHWTHLPNRLIIDSGAYQSTQKASWLTPVSALERQREMIELLTIPVSICHLDVPMFRTRNVAELEHFMVRNIQHARWLIEYIRNNPLPDSIRIIGVIQGYDVQTTYNVARTLADMGYTDFALGSLASVVTKNRDELYRRVESALEAVGSNLHIFGISSIAVLTKLAHLGIASADSSAPAHEAYRGGLFYSNPFRRYKIPSPHFKEWQRSYSFADILNEPLPCDCPVCQEDSLRLLQPVGKSFIRLRAIHNCYHLYREINAIPSRVT